MINTPGSGTTQTVAIFDFDKTLIAEDSFFRFSLLTSHGLMERILAVSMAILCSLGIVDNDEYKLVVLKRLWVTKSPEQREAIAESLQQYLKTRVRPDVLSHAREHVKSGAFVVVMSASPEFYLKPFIEELLPRVNVIGSTTILGASEIQIDNNFGARKTARARHLMDEMEPSEVYVYTDSLADFGLMSLATRLFLISPSAKCVATVRKEGLDFEILSR